MSMKQIERIKEMELRMQRASAALKELMAALDHFEGEKEDFAKLSDYYGSKEWKQDFEADRDGQLQEDQDAASCRKTGSGTCWRTIMN